MKHKFLYSDGSYDCTQKRIELELSDDVHFCQINGTGNVKHYGNLWFGFKNKHDL